MSCSSTVHAIPKWRTCLAHLFPPGARIAGCSLTSHDSCDMLWYFFLAPKTVLFHPIFQSHRFSPGKQWYIPSIWSNCRSLVIFRVLCLSAIDNSKVIGSAFCLGCAVNSSCTILFVEFDWHSVHVSAFLPINFITHCENMWEPFPILALHHHFYPDILDVHSWAWSKKMGTESFQAQISNSSRWVFQVGGALCLFRAHHFWSSHELSTCCSLNAGPKLATQEHPWNVPKESAMKVRSTSFACSFFFFEGCITTWLFLSLFLVYILFTQFFLLHPFWEPWDLSGVGQALAGTIKSKLTRNFRRQRSDPESKQSTGLRVCIVSASAGLVFVAEMTDTMRTTRSRMKVEQNFYVRTFVKVRPFLRVERRLHMLHELHSFGDLQVLCWSFVLLCPSTAMPLQMSLDSLARALAPWYVSFGHWGESLSWSFQWVLFSIV